ncbi:unnamed protein product [Gordionus sp. m RMFG-2023]
MLSKNLFMCIKKDGSVTMEENGRVQLKKERKGFCRKLRDWFNWKRRARKQEGKNFIGDNVPVEKDIERVYCSDMVEAKLKNYSMINVIGQGAYGKVLLAESKATKELYALKVIQKNPLKPQKTFDRFRIEKKILETSRNNPFIVKFHSSFETPSKYIFALEYVNGGDLRRYMKKTGKLSEDSVKFYLSEIIVGLNFLHSMGIAHRDLKPENVLLDKDGHIRITDFGLSKIGLNGNKKTRSLCGTPAYLAPEMIGCKGYGFSVDFYALGIIMYEMLTGNEAFVYAREQRRTLCQRLFGKRKTVGITDISEEASAVLKGFLQKNPKKRLGCHPQSGFQQMVSMPFFKAIDWELLKAKKVIPPYKPPLSGRTDISNFNSKFRAQEPILTSESK